MKEIPLTKGRVALVDDEDFAWLTFHHTWHAHVIATGYATALATIGGRTVLMHRMIMGAKNGQMIDHINHDALDNRRCNLRFCTRSENGRNRIVKPHSSRYKGVAWCKRFSRWVANINLGHDKHKHLGYFFSEEDAARAYDEAARSVFGHFALTNADAGVLP